MKGCIKLRLAQPVAQTSNLLYRGFSNPPPKAQRLNLSSAWTEICPIWDIFLSREFGHSEAGILAGNSFFPGKFQVSNLLCRRLPVGRPFPWSSAGGLETRDTAD